MASSPRPRLRDGRSPLGVALVATGLVAGVLVVGAGPARADDPPPPPPPPGRHFRPQRPPPPPRPGRADGAAVKPGPRARGDLPPPRFAREDGPRYKRERHADVLPAEGTPIASSPEFVRQEDGKSRLFVEVSQKVEVVESRTAAAPPLPGPPSSPLGSPPGTAPAPAVVAGRVVYHLRGTAMVQHTNQLSLPTGVFVTPVERVKLVPVGPDLDLIIELREPTELSYSVVETPRGMVLWVDFSRSASFGREEERAEPTHKRARYSTASTTLGGTGADDPSPPTDDN